MALKFRLVDQRGCGVPPVFDLSALETASLPPKLSPDDVLSLLNDCNAWIAKEWTSWWNLGWLFLGCCLYRFVKNDLLMRTPLREYVAERTRELSKRSEVVFEVHRKVKTYGYGETSRTVVKISLVVLDANFYGYGMEAGGGGGDGKGKRGGNGGGGGNGGNNSASRQKGKEEEGSSSKNNNNNNTNDDLSL